MPSLSSTDAKPASAINRDPASPRILFLGVNFSNWVCTTLYEEQKAIAARLPASVFYGPGYRYQTNRVEEIIAETFPTHAPDALFCYIDERRLLGEPLSEAVVAHHRIPPERRIFPVGLKSVQIPKFAWINDFWHCTREEWDEILLGNGFHAAFSTYCPPFCAPAVFEEFFSPKVRDRIRFIPWPRAIAPEVFHDYGLPKIHDVTLLGAMDRGFYPVRHAMHEFLSQTREWKYFSRPHPGYRYVEEHAALVGENYARTLNQSRIFCSCTGKYHIPFIKLYEVLGCRAALMCDRPSGAEFLGLRPRETYLEVNPANFPSLVRAALNDPDTVNQIAKQGHELVRQRHTAEIRAREFEETMTAMIQGRSPSGWAELNDTRGTAAKPSRGAPARPHVSPNHEPTRMHILEVAPKLDVKTWKFWLKFGLNNRPNEHPPVVTTYPELVVLRGVYLRHLAATIRARHLAEIGTARGFQSMLWSEYLLEAGGDGIVHTCDIDGMDAPIYKIPLGGNTVFTRRQLWSDEPSARLIQFTHGDAHRMAPSITQPLDVVYIDGEHTESAVDKDLEALWPKLRPGSIVVFDDCDTRFPGVEKAVARFAARVEAAYEMVEFTPALYKIAIVRIPEGWEWKCGLREPETGVIRPASVPNEPANHSPEAKPAALPLPAPPASRSATTATLKPVELTPDFVPRALAQEGGWVIVSLGNLRFRLHPGRYLDRELIVGRLFESTSIRILHQLLRPGQTVVDVGANFGFYTLLLSRWVGPTGHVIAFEPTREYGLRNEAHQRDNHVTNVRFEPCGLSDYDHTADIQIGECSGTMHWTAPSKPRATETIRLVRFDDWWSRYVAEGHPDRLDFLKLDVDGHELPTLRGGRRTLLRHRPVLLVEFYKPNFEKAGYTCADLADFLERELGYQLCSEETGNPFANRATFLAAADRPDLSVNVFCVPTPASPAADAPSSGEIFTNPAELYLASADRMDRVMSNLERVRHELAPAVDTYATVIGGLSGLNYLTALTPKEIIFYDINPVALGYARLMVELIGLSASPRDFISRVFSRPVTDFLAEIGAPDLTVANQERYLACPVDEALLAGTLAALSPAGRETFEAFLRPHLAGRTLEGVRNCRRLLPCWPANQRVPVGGGAALGCDEAGQLVPNTNTFFYGLGWLAAPETFALVRQALGQATLSYQQFDLLHRDLPELAAWSGSWVLHVSNIDDWFPQDWPRLVRQWQKGALTAQCRLTVLSSHNGLTLMAADAHAWALGALAPHVTGKVVEVTHKVPWGFHEFPRVNVALPQYLEGDFPADTTILHILLGEGAPRPDFLAAYRKAVAASRRVIVLEHNRDSADWAPHPPAHFVNEPELRALLLDGSAPVRVTHARNIRGEKDDRRNFMLVLESETPAVNPALATLLAWTGKPKATLPTPAPPPGSQAPARPEAKPRVLLIVDVPNWIFARHCRMLERFLGDRFQFTTQCVGAPVVEDNFDLIYPLEWNLVPPQQVRAPAKYVTGIRSQLSWRGQDFLPFVDYLATRFQRVHVVSKRLQHMFEPFLPTVAHVTHGIDTEFFAPRTLADQSGRGKIRIGWAGNRVNPTKGFEQYVLPLSKLPGVELAFCGFQDKNLNLERMREFYDGLDVYVCASSLHHEGNNNSLMEAAAMRRAIITTDNGAVPEYLRHGDNAMIVERELPNFIRAVIELRDDPAQRLALGERARLAVQARFEWRDMAERYAALFLEALARRPSWRPDAEACRRFVTPPAPAAPTPSIIPIVARPDGAHRPGAAALGV